MITVTVHLIGASASSSSHVTPQWTRLRLAVPDDDPSCPATVSTLLTLVGREVQAMNLFPATDSFEKHDCCVYDSSGSMLTRAFPLQLVDTPQFYITFSSNIPISPKLSSSSSSCSTEITTTTDPTITTTGIPSHSSSLILTSGTCSPPPQSASLQFLGPPVEVTPVGTSTSYQLEDPFLMSNLDMRRRIYDHLAMGLRPFVLSLFAAHPNNPIHAQTGEQLPQFEGMIDKPPYKLFTVDAAEMDACASSHDVYYLIKYLSKLDAFSRALFALCLRSNSANQQSSLDYLVMLNAAFSATRKLLKRRNDLMHFVYLGRADERKAGEIGADCDDVISVFQFLLSWPSYPGMDVNAPYRVDTRKAYDALLKLRMSFQEQHFFRRRITAFSTGLDANPKVFVEKAQQTLQILQQQLSNADETSEEVVDLARFVLTRMTARCYSFSDEQDQLWAKDTAIPALPVPAARVPTVRFHSNSNSSSFSPSSSSTSYFYSSSPRNQHYYSQQQQSQSQSQRSRPLERSMTAPSSSLFVAAANVDTIDTVVVEASAVENIVIAATEEGQTIDETVQIMEEAPEQVPEVLESMLQDEEDEEEEETTFLPPAETSSTPANVVSAANESTTPAAPILPHDVRMKLEQYAHIFAQQFVRNARLYPNVDVTIVFSMSDKRSPEGARKILWQVCTLGSVDALEYFMNAARQILYQNGFVTYVGQHIPEAYRAIPLTVDLVSRFVTAFTSPDNAMITISHQVPCVYGADLFNAAKSTMPIDCMDILQHRITQVDTLYQYFKFAVKEALLAQGYNILGPVPKASSPVNYAVNSQSTPRHALGTSVSLGNQHQIGHSAPAAEASPADKKEEEEHLQRGQESEGHENMAEVIGRL